jgi:diacylglycerol kinase family enzyme
MRRGWEPADPPQRPVLFMNPKSGGGKAARADLGRRARDRGIDVIVLRPDDNFVALVGEAVDGDADALGVAGGDGSLAVVAAAAVEHRLPLICVPAGTRNHFALDLGIDRQDLVGSLDAFGDHGVERSIDVAEVNGRLFLNNVSLGIYGEAVQQTAYRDAKVRTLVETTAEVLGPSRAARELRLVDDLGREHRHAAVVLVSNNPYALDRPVAPGTRPRLDGGELGIVVLDRPRPRADPPARVWTATHFGVDAEGSMHAGVDGEAVELDAPLGFVIRPGALRVRISSRHPGVSPSQHLR